MTTQNPSASDLPVDMIIFGGGGDLSARKLLPALYMAHLHCNLPPETRIIAIGRKDWSRDQYLAFMEEHSRPFVDSKALDPQSWDKFLALFDYVRIDIDSAADFQRLAQTSRPNALRVFYLATAPDLFTTICDNLTNAGLVDEHSRVVLEKPLGHDLASAQAINESVGQHFKEAQIYRIDHYLGKETVQNLMVLRFGNAIFGPLWQAPYIKSVQITVAETVGVGSRAGFYDQTGALRDMVQNHLLQLLCIVAMEPPVSLDPDAVRDEKLKVLRSLRPMSVADIARDTVRGQYAAGAIGGEPVKGYMEEANVPAESRAETFVALRARINNWRWANVPFFLRTGKRLQKRQSEIVIDFADLPFSIIPSGPRNYGNRLIIQLQPEGIDPASDAREGTGQRHAHAAGQPEPGLAAGVHRASRGSVRAASHRRDSRTPHALHAPRRTRSGVGLGRTDPRGLEGTQRPSARLHGGDVRAGGVVGADGSREHGVGRRGLMRV